MTINRGGKKDSNSVPQKLDEILIRAFTDQALSSKYEDLFKADKGEIIAYLEKNDDGFEIDMGKGFKCDQGSVIYTSRANWKFDTDKILELVESGHVTLATILNACNFSAEKLKTAIGESKFSGLASQTSTEYLTLRASSEFKTKVEEQFNPSEASAPAAPKVAPKPKAEPKTDSKSKLAAAKLAVEKAKSKSKSADDDLADILGD